MYVNDVFISTCICNLDNPSVRIHDAQIFKGLLFMYMYMPLIPMATHDATLDTVHVHVCIQWPEHLQLKQEVLGSGCPVFFLFQLAY